MCKKSRVAPESGVTGCGDRGQLETESKLHGCGFRLINLLVKIKHTSLEYGNKKKKKTLIEPNKPDEPFWSKLKVLAELFFLESRIRSGNIFV